MRGGKVLSTLFLLVLAGVLLVPNVAAAIADDAIAFWTFNAGDGNTTDYYGIHSAVTLESDIHNVTGVAGDAMRSPGSADDSIELPSIFGTAGDFTMSMWLRPYAGDWTNNECVLNQGSFFYFQLDGSDLIMQYYLGAGWKQVCSITGLDNSSWTHITFAYDHDDGGDMTCYVNGTESGNHTGQMTFNSNTITWGAEAAGGNPATWEVDGIGAWNRTLSTSEITTISTVATAEPPHGSIAVSSINFTSDGNTQCSYPGNCGSTTDRLPDFTIITDQDGVCRMSQNNTEYANMTNTCTQNGDANTTHTCIMATQMSTGAQEIYFQCNSTSGTLSTYPTEDTGKVNITYSLYTIPNASIYLNETTMTTDDLAMCLYNISDALDQTYNASWEWTVNGTLIGNGSITDTSAGTLNNLIINATSLYRKGDNVTINFTTIWAMGHDNITGLLNSSIIGNTPPSQFNLSSNLRGTFIVVNESWSYNVTWTNSSDIDIDHEEGVDSINFSLYLNDSLVLDNITGNNASFNPNDYQHLQSYVVNMSVRDNLAVNWTNHTFSVFVYHHSGGVLSVRNDTITSSTVTIVFNTTYSVNGTINYGTTSSLGTKQTFTNTTNHSVQITGLTASTLYHYRIEPELHTDYPGYDDFLQNNSFMTNFTTSAAAGGGSSSGGGGGSSTTVVEAALSTSTEAVGSVFVMWPFKDRRLDGGFNYSVVVTANQAILQCTSEVFDCEIKGEDKNKVVISKIIHPGDNFIETVEGSIKITATGGIKTLPVKVTAYNLMYSVPLELSFIDRSDVADKIFTFDNGGGTATGIIVFSVVVIILLFSMVITPLLKGAL
jgi:hypothetical protein